MPDPAHLLGISPAAESLGFAVERGDDIEHNDDILDIICAKIEAADAVVADTTGSNPNVFYEVGYAHASGVPTILICRNDSVLPFDVRGKNHIVFERIVDLRERLKTRLRHMFFDGRDP